MALAATFAMFVLVGCGAEESSASGETNGESASTNGESASTNGSEAPIDLTTIDLKAAVAAQVNEAAAEDMYGCCLKMPCTQCIVNMGGCPCGGNLLDGNPVCHECKGGWSVGGGDIDGVSAEDVVAMPRGDM